MFVAERNPLLRSGIACLLDESSDVTIIGEVRPAEQPLALAGENNTDVVLLDAKLPDGSRVEVVRRFHDQVRSPKIMAVIEQADEAEIFNLISSGATGLVSRKDQPNPLLEAIRSMAAGDDVWRSPRVATSLVPIGRRTTDLFKLRARERELLEYVARGHRNENIAAALDISTSTVRNHLSDIYSKLEIHTHSEAVARAWRSGLVRPDYGSDDCETLVLNGDDNNHNEAVTLVSCVVTKCALSYPPL